MKIRKQIYELTVEDLNRFPVWEFALDEECVQGQDEATVRPCEISGPLDPSDGMFVVKASFTLADGSKVQGYLTPPVTADDSLGTLQPVIVTAAGQVMFWCGMRVPSPNELAQQYRSLGRDANHVFPIWFESQVDLVGEKLHGRLLGFMVLEDWETQKVRVVT